MSQPTSAGGTAGPRFRAGVALFVAGLACPALIPVVASSDLPGSWKATISGFLMLGLPELLWIAAAGVMGKPGFEYLKSRAFGWLARLLFPQTVSRTRYRLGLVLALLVLGGDFWDKLKSLFLYDARAQLEG